MTHRVFRKTEHGKAEVARRSGSLPPAARSVLIMVNGSDSVAALTAQGLPQVQVHLQRLLAMGLIELAGPPPASDAPAAPAKPPQTPPAPAPEAPPAAPAAHHSPAVPDERLSAQCRLVLAHLSQHFGPDTPQVAQAVLAARTTGEFNAAIDAIESRLATHLGRKQAAREAQALRLNP